MDISHLSCCHLDRNLVARPYRLPQDNVTDLLCTCVMSDVCTSCIHEGTALLYFSSGVQPATNLHTLSVFKRRVSYTFGASPTSGATYKVTFIPQRAGIPQPPTDTFNNGGFRAKGRLIPDVTYRLQVVAVLNGVESSAISKDFTTRPDGKTITTFAT